MQSTRKVVSAPVVPTELCQYQTHRNSKENFVETYRFRNSVSHVKMSRKILLRDEAVDRAKPGLCVALGQVAADPEFWG